MSGVEAPPRASDGATVAGFADPPGDRREPVIRTRGLTKKYGTLTAVNRLDLEVFPGEIFGLLGQNGAGKTTTILMLLGLSEPTDGEAAVMGLDPAWEPREVKRRVGYLPDAVGFYGGMTGRQNLRYTAKLNGLRRHEAEPAIDEVLVQVGLADRADDRVETYSRGMRQRLGIADALVKSPDLLILDEPTTSIDPLGVVEILDLLRRLTDERGIAILLSSHLLSQVQSVCDRIGIFASGRLVGMGTVEELARTFGDGTAVIEVAFELPTEADVERAGATLRGIRSVESVEPPTHAGDAWRLRVRPADEEGRVRQDILLAAVQHSLRLTAIRPLVPSLDDIYRVAVERPLPKRGVKVKGRRRREAMAAAGASSAANEASSGAVEPVEGVEPVDPAIEPGEPVETGPSLEERDA
ncbi:MAG: ATP-binding cassette domain-containing protein [Chloroflexota bacterium]